MCQVWDKFFLFALRVVTVSETGLKKSYNPKILSVLFSCVGSDVMYPEAYSSLSEKWTATKRGLFLSSWNNLIKA